MYVYNRICVCIAWIFKIKTFKNHHFLEENRDPLRIFFSVIFLTIHMGFCSFPDPKMARQWMQWEIRPGS